MKRDFKRFKLDCCLNYNIHVIKITCKLDPESRICSFLPFMLISRQCFWNLSYKAFVPVNYFHTTLCMHM
jgi:hypothetical protein